jgi:hypothetical protein
MPKGEAKLNPKSVEERRNSILRKCHPAMFEFVLIWREGIDALKKMGPSPPKEAIAEIENKFYEKLEEIHREYSGAVSPEPNRFAAQIIFSKSAMESNSDALGVTEWLHFERHRVPMQHDAARLSARDWDASRRLQRTVSDLEQLRCGGGPIQAFKTDREHWSLFATLWGLGIEKLTSDELAVFFDDVCACWSETHEPESLTKQRARFRRVLDKAQASNAPDL